MQRTLRLLSVSQLGAAFAAALVAYFTLVVPTDLAVLLVGSAVALVFASYAPLLGVLAVGRLVG